MIVVPISIAITMKTVSPESERAEDSNGPGDGLHFNESVMYQAGQELL